MVPNWRGGVESGATTQTDARLIPELRPSCSRPHGSSSLTDPFAALGLSATAPEDEIKRAYWRLAHRHHPDLNPGDSQAAERFQRLNTCFTEALLIAARRTGRDTFGTASVRIPCIVWDESRGCFRHDENLCRSHHQPARRDVDLLLSAPPTALSAPRVSGGDLCESPNIPVADAWTPSGRLLRLSVPTVMRSPVAAAGAPADELWRALRTVVEQYARLHGELRNENLKLERRQKKLRAASARNDSNHGALALASETVARLQSELTMLRAEAAKRPVRMLGPEVRSSTLPE